MIIFVYLKLLKIFLFYSALSLILPEKTPLLHICAVVDLHQGHHFILFNIQFTSPFCSRQRQWPNLAWGTQLAFITSLLQLIFFFSAHLACWQVLSVHPSIRPSALRGWSLRTSQCPSLRRLSSSDAGWLCSSSAWGDARWEKHLVAGVLTLVFLNEV